MKKIFMFAAMASVALASCVKNEPVANVEQGDLITFDAPVVAPVTKANAEFEGESFKVYSYYQAGEADYAGAGTIYINGATVDNEFATGKWKVTDKEYYWPKNGHLSFVAYSPVSASATSAADKLTIAYVVNSAANEDLLVSEWNNKLTYGATGEVPLAFNHVLSNVNFTFTSAIDNPAGDVVSITGITLKKVNTTATYTQPYNTAGSWGATSVTTDYTVYTGEPVLLKNLVLTQQEFLLLPQTLTDDVVLHVDYTLPADGADGTPTTLAQEADIKLNSDTTIATWSKGIKYNYTITFDVRTMTFVPTVVEDTNWTVGVDGSLSDTL